MSNDSTDNRARFAQATEITTATYDRVASDYAERNEDRSGRWTERMEQFVELLEENEARQPIPELGRPGDDATLEEYLQFVPVLDAGCGPGQDTRALAAYDLPVLGVDISQGMLDEAGERTARRLPKGFIRYALMDMRRLDLPDASCRGVWCSASLLHLPLRTAPRAVGELVRVMRAGGPLAVFLKQRAPGAEAERMVPYEHMENEVGERFYAYYTPDEVRSLFEGAGLEIQDVTAFPGTRPTDAAGWVTLLARKPV
jgi:SAM-dependent methyltransferase